MISFHTRLKRHFTLFETLIAVSLLSVLLVFVFSFFRELSEVTRLTNQVQKESFKMRYLESRLNFVFERLVHEKEIKTRPFYFYTQPYNRDFTDSTSLIFSYDNEVRSNPTFSGDVLARLYVDSEHRLCLATWPMHVEDPHLYMQEEILIPDKVVESVSFFFYVAPEKIQSSKEITSAKQVDGADKKTPEKDKWHEDEWAKTYAQMPSILKIEVNLVDNEKELEHYHRGMRKDTHKHTYHFVLPSALNPVQYPQQG